MPPVPQCDSQRHCSVDAAQHVFPEGTVLVVGTVSLVMQRASVTCACHVIGASWCWCGGTHACCVTALHHNSGPVLCDQACVTDSLIRLTGHIASRADSSLISHAPQAGAGGTALSKVARRMARNLTTQQKLHTLRMVVDLLGTAQVRALVSFGVVCNMVVSYNLSACPFTGLVAVDRRTLPLRAVMTLTFGQLWQMHSRLHNPWGTNRQCQPKCAE